MINHDNHYKSAFYPPTFFIVHAKSKLLVYFIFRINFFFAKTMQRYIFTQNKSFKRKKNKNV